MGSFLPRVKLVHNHKERVVGVPDGDVDCCYCCLVEDEHLLMMKCKKSDHHHHRHDESWKNICYG
jgi:hypothetical protein